MTNKQVYESLRLDVFRLSVEDIVRTSSEWENEGGAGGGTDLPPDFE